MGVRCQGDHGLGAYPLNKDWKCDHCNKQMTMGSFRMACITCDIDLCSVCANLEVDDSAEEPKMQCDVDEESNAQDNALCDASIVDKRAKKKKGNMGKKK